MNIAICFFGLSGGMNDKNELINNSDSLKSIKNLIIKPNKDIGNKCDIFFHTWKYKNLDNNKIINDYNPIEYIIDKRIHFDNDIKWNYIYSRWYSHSKVLKLKMEYEKKNNFEYDYVLLVRFDCIFFEKIIFNFSNKYIYSALWYGANYESQKIELLDYWFISNSKNMNIIATIYDNLNNYKSKYAEFYIKQGSKVKSNHSLIKIHLDENNLSNKLKYVFVEFIHFTLNKWKSNLCQRFCNEPFSRVYGGPLLLNTDSKQTLYNKLKKCTFENIL